MLPSEYFHRNVSVVYIIDELGLAKRYDVGVANIMWGPDFPHSTSSWPVDYQLGREMLERVGLGNRLDHEPSQLSGGQQQRVAIARSLVNHPPLLFADEPTGNLDSKTSKEILRMFQQLNREQGITIMLVTHDAEVASYARRTIHIRDGLIEDGIYNAEPDTHESKEPIVLTQVMDKP